MTKPTDDTVARMLGVTQAHEVPADDQGWFAALEFAEKNGHVHAARLLRQKIGSLGLWPTDPDPLPPGERVLCAAEPTLNRDATVAVSPTYTYNEDMSQAPRGVKLILLGASGVAVLTEYNGKNPFWVGWAALPRRADRD